MAPTVPGSVSARSLEANFPASLQHTNSGVGIQDWEAAQTPEVDFKRPVTAWVALSSGKRFRSESKTLAA
jgi:hypothetical protein